jgi:methylated-DNA-[protein]-cysteine S-methyltransferase
VSELFIAYYNSPTGELEITSSEKAITSILFFTGKEKAATASSETLSHCIKQLDEYFSGKRREFTLATEQPGTDFQKKVWQELQNIPFGKTISYLDLAKRLGDVKSIRAAATANGKNMLSIIVPCHRVIGSDGSLTGYSGGLKNKQWLLDHEAEYANGVQKLF